jgi:hypothetical protein
MIAVTVTPSVASKVTGLFKKPRSVPKRKNDLEPSVGFAIRIKARLCGRFPSQTFHDELMKLSRSRHESAFPLLSDILEPNCSFRRLISAQLR